MLNDNLPEILAPVGGEEQLLAAVRCGADAVYFGMQNFNARRNAENFGSNLKTTIDYCHLHGVKVNITVNTLVTDPELKDMKQAVDDAAGAGADALIIQDLAVAAYVKKHWPGLAMHASTQMAAHNSEGVKELIDYGFSRVVLARELSLEEIKKIYDETHAELEVFVHGAHCMSVSGNCYMSSMIGARSGNRGLCAQPCRLDWTVGDRDHALSLKDLSYIPKLKEIADAGVCSVKIEGRMKRPEYVAASVLACRQALGLSSEGGFSVTQDILRSVFSRSGFTDGYLSGKRDISMFGYRTKEDVLAAENVLGELAKTYEKEPQNIPVSMHLIVRKDEKSQLKISTGKDSVSVDEHAESPNCHVGSVAMHSVNVFGDEPQIARTLPLNKEYAERFLSKTGGTPFYLDELTLDADEGQMLPGSALNDMRRRALDELTVKITEDNTPKNRRADPRTEYLPEYHAPIGRRFRLRFEKADQIFPLDSIISDLSCQIILPLAELYRHKELLSRGVWAEIPSLIWEGNLDRIYRTLKQLHDEGLNDVLCENIGAVRMAKELGLTIHGGCFLNTLNSEAVREYEGLGLKDLTMSFELAFSLERKLKGTLPRGFIGYGYLPLMKLRACPGRGEKGCAGCEGLSCLTDRTGADFALICRDKQYSEILNCVPVYVADKSLPPADFETLYFTIETKERAEAVFRDYIAKAAPSFSRTGGLYYRELL